MSEQFRVSTADAAAIAAVLAMSAAAMGGDLNDAFPGQTIQGAPSGVIINSDLEDRGCGYGSGGGSECPGPDTVLGVFDALSNLVAIDDNSSFYGNGLASAVYWEPIPSNGLIAWIVSGFGDFDFDGFRDSDPSFTHGEIGAWQGWVDYYDAQGFFVGFDYMGLFEFDQGDEVFSGGLTVPAEALGGFYDIYLDNLPFGCGCTGDVDFYRVTGLIPGLVYEIRVTNAVFDSILGLFDTDGVLIDFNDDDPINGCCLSVLEAPANAVGELTFAVSAFADFDFIGDHTSDGGYQVRVGPRGEGCSAADLAAPFGVLDLTDIVAFVVAFSIQDFIADLAEPLGVFDLDDVLIFIQVYEQGCF